MTIRLRKKPVEVLAVQWTGDNELEIMDFVGRKLAVSKPPSAMEHDKEIPNSAYAIIIDTLEGDMRADRQDWIIKGVNGEFYPCKPEILTKTYDKIDFDDSACFPPSRY